MCRDWKKLNLNYKIVARIHEDLCIGCQLCYVACWDGAHQCIHLDRTSAAPDTTKTPGMVEVEAQEANFDDADCEAGRGECPRECE